MKLPPDALHIKARRVLHERLMGLEPHGKDTENQPLCLETLMDFFLDDFVECLGHENFKNFLHGIAERNKDDTSACIFEGLTTAANRYMETSQGKQALTDVVEELK